MSNILNRDTILQANAETGIHPAFIEKDWYSVRLLKLLSEFENDRGIELVFAGGTSLSKGFGLINRFSEDLDFLLWSPEPVKKSGRRAFRKSIISHIMSDPHFTIEEDKIEIYDESRQFKVHIQCDMAFEDKDLRPYLQLEMIFSDHRLPPSKQDVQSVISKVAGKAPEVQLPASHQ